MRPIRRGPANPASAVSRSPFGLGTLCSTCADAVCTSTEARDADRTGPYTCSHVGHIGNPRAPPTTRRPDHLPAHPATRARITPLPSARGGGASRLACPTERTRGLGRRVRRRRRRPYRAALDGSTGNRSRRGRRKRAVAASNGGGCRSAGCGVALRHRRFSTGQWNDSACTRDRCCARCRARGGSARRSE